MNNQMKGLLYFYMTSMRYSFIIFWSILLGILVLTLSIGFVLKDTDGIMNFNFTFPLIFYTGIYGGIAVKNWLPFIIKLGATRKNIFLSVGIFFLCVSLVFTTFASVIQSIINSFIKWIGLDIFYFSHISLLFSDTWYTRIYIDTAMILLVFAISLAITLFFYRYGLTAGFGLLGIIFLVFMLGMFQGWIPRFVMDVLPNITLSFFGILALLAFIIYSMNWFTIRKVTVKDTQ